MKNKKQSLGTLVITKELFTAVIETIRLQMEYDDKRTDAFQVILSSDYVSGYDNSLLTIQLILLLQIAFEDDNRESWIDYFIYELEFGVKYTEGCVSKSGKNIPLKTVSDLWNLLNLDNNYPYKFGG